MKGQGLLLSQINLLRQSKLLKFLQKIRNYLLLSLLVDKKLLSNSGPLSIKLQSFQSHKQKKNLQIILEFVNEDPWHWQCLRCFSFFPNERERVFLFSFFIYNLSHIFIFECFYFSAVFSGFFSLEICILSQCLLQTQCQGLLIE